MQEVQTWTRRGVPFTMARTRWMLGFHRRLVRRCEWLMLMPNDGFLPHTSHTAAMTRNLSRGRIVEATLARLTEGQRALVASREPDEVSAGVPELASAVNEDARAARGGR